MKVYNERKKKLVEKVKANIGKIMNIKFKHIVIVRRVMVKVRLMLVEILACTGPKVNITLKQVRMSVDETQLMDKGKMQKVKIKLVIGKRIIIQLGKQ